eukprot:sb/3477282/
MKRRHVALKYVVALIVRGLQSAGSPVTQSSPKGSAHTKVKIKIKIFILTAHTPAAVKISLSHSTSNNLARQFDGVLKFCHPTRPSKSVGVNSVKIKILILILTLVCADP